MNNSEKRIFQKKDFFIVAFFISIALIFRLYNSLNTSFSANSSRQVYVASIGRNFVNQGFDLLHPMVDDSSTNVSGHNNPKGYYMGSLPIYSATFSFLYKYFPIISLEDYARLTSIFSSLVVLSLIYYLLIKEEGRIAAVTGALIFGCMPFFVFYSRVILPDMTALSFFLLSLFFLYHIKEQVTISSILFFLSSAIFYSLALTMIPAFIFFLPVIIYTWYRIFGNSLLLKPTFYLYLLLVFAPFLLWSWWINQFPESMPKEEFLFHFYPLTLKETAPSYVLFLRTVFNDKIMNLILGGYVSVFFIVGLLKKQSKNFFFTIIALSTFLYILVLPREQTWYEYYQILILPCLAMLCGTGIQILTTNKKIIHPAVAIIGILVIFIFSFYTSYNQIKRYYDTENFGTISKIIDDLIDPTELVATDTNGDPTLLYLSARKGMSVLTEITTLHEKNIRYVVVFDKQKALDLQKDNQLLFESDQVYIVKLL